MADMISVTSNLPLGFPAAEGLTIMPGTSEVDAKAWAAWKATKPGLIESGDVVETGSQDHGKPTPEGSTVTDPGPVPAEAMRTGSADAPAAPVLASTAPLKVPVTADAPGLAPVVKAQPVAQPAAPAAATK